MYTATAASLEATSNQGANCEETFSIQQQSCNKQKRKIIDNGKLIIFNTTIMK